jgi:hypothetical protein
MVVKNVKTTFQEELNEISFSRVLEQVDSEIWRLHLEILKQKCRSLLDLNTWPDMKKQEIQAPCLPERDKCRICYSWEWTQRREAFLLGRKAS